LIFGRVPDVQNALPITVMIGASLIVSFLEDRMRKGNRVRVQLKIVLRMSHHCGFAGTSQTTIPGLSPVRIRKRQVNVSICFHLHSTNAARKSERLVFETRAL
jgi:hypothetical protein